MIRNEFEGIGQPAVEIVFCPGQPRSKQCPGVVVSWDGTCPPAEDTAEHRPSLVAIESVACGASFSEKLLSSMGVRLGRGDEAGEVFRLIGLH